MVGTLLTSGPMGPPTGLFWSVPLASDSDFTEDEPLALDYLGQQVGRGR